MPRAHFCGERYTFHHLLQRRPPQSRTVTTAAMSTKQTPSVAASPSLSLPKSPVSPSANSTPTPSTPPPTPPTPPPASPTHTGYGPLIYDTASEISKQIVHAVRISEQNRFVKGLVLGLTALAVTAVGLYLYSDKVKSSTATQLSDVTMRTLSTDSVQSSVNEMSNELIRKLLNDSAIQHAAINFLHDILQQDATHKALVEVATSALADSKTMEMVNIFSQQLISRLSNSSDVQSQVAHLLQQAILLPESKDALIKLGESVLKDPANVKFVTDLAVTTSHNTLNDDSVREHSVAWFKSVLSDSTLQQSTGDALWGAVKYGLSPRWGAHGKNTTTTTTTTVPISAAMATPLPVAASVATTPVVPLSPQSLPATTLSKATPVYTLTVPSEHHHNATTLH